MDAVDPYCQGLPLIAGVAQSPEALDPYQK